MTPTFEVSLLPAQWHFYASTAGSTLQMTRLYMMLCSDTDTSQTPQAWHDTHPTPTDTYHTDASDTTGVSRHTSDTNNVTHRRVTDTTGVSRHTSDTNEHITHWRVTDTTGVARHTSYTNEHITTHGTECSQRTDTVHDIWREVTDRQTSIVCVQSKLSGVTVCIRQSQLDMLIWRGCETRRCETVRSHTVNNYTSEMSTQPTYSSMDVNPEVSSVRYTQVGQKQVINTKTKHWIYYYSDLCRLLQMHCPNLCRERYTFNLTKNIV